MVLFVSLTMPIVFCVHASSLPSYKEWQALKATDIGATSLITTPPDAIFIY